MEPTGSTATAQYPQQPSEARYKRRVKGLEHEDDPKRKIVVHKGAGANRALEIERQDVKSVGQVAIRVAVKSRHAERLHGVARQASRAKGSYRLTEAVGRPIHRRVRNSFFGVFTRMA